MSVKFETKEAAEELNSLCSFCGLLKFRAEEVNGAWHLVRHIPFPDSEYCQFNHKNERIEIRPQEHNDFMMVVRGN